MAYALQLRKKHGKPSVRARKTSVRVQYTYYQNTHTNTQEAYGGVDVKIHIYNLIQQ